MGERSDGRWAARLVGVSAPRQQGKSQLIVARALAGVLLFGEQTIICSAHQTDTAREVFQRLLDIIEGNPGLARRVDSVMRAINREHIRFASGQVIRIKARSVAGGRGFSSDCLLLDEAQILGAPAWATILPTMSARENPQAWLLGTPPTPQDDGEVFARIRQRGVEGKDPRLAYVEWSADADDDLDDVEAWARANPALGSRVLLEAVESERAAMTDEQFALERLGMWADAAVVRQVIPASSWTEAGDELSVAVDHFALGVEAGPDLAGVSVSLAGQRGDGLWHVELYERKDGSAWLAPYLEGLVAANPQIRAVVGDVGGPLVSLLEQRHGGWFVKDTKVRITPLKVADLGAACTKLLDGVVTGWLRHTRQPQVGSAVQVAGKRALGDTGMWVWSRRSTVSDITPVQSMTYALWGAQSTSVKRPVRTSGGQSNRRAVIL